MCPSTETHARTLSPVQQVPCFYARRNLRLEPESLISERALCAFARTSLKCPWAVRIGLIKDEKERRKQRRQETTDLELGFFFNTGICSYKVEFPVSRGVRLRALHLRVGPSGLGGSSGFRESPVQEGNA